MIMVLPLTCVVSMKLQIVGKQLREVSSSWFRRAHPRAEAGNGTVTGLHYHWHCPGCGARDMSSFRICRCGRQTAQEYAATCERSKHYGFHGHFACGEKDAEAAARHHHPGWHVRDMAQQRKEEAKRLYKEGRRRVCRAHLDWWRRVLDHDEHPQCSF